MNELTIINQQEVLGRDFKVYGTPEEPLFLAKDVAEWIEHTDVSKMMRNIDECEKVANIVRTLGGNQTAWFLTEDGLYEVLMQSRKPIAKQFKAKVKEILKDIRNYGVYMTNEKIEAAILNPDVIIKIATALKEERAKSAELERQIEQDKPLVNFANSIQDSDDTILIGSMAKLIKQKGITDIGQNRMFEWLRENGYLIARKGSDWNMPTQYSIDHNLFNIKETVIATSDGVTKIRKTVKVTGKGQVYFINKFTSLYNINQTSVICNQA